MKEKTKSILNKIINQKDLTEMLVSVELTKQAGKIGFDWPDIKYVFDKMHEELDELLVAMKSGIKEDIIDETGDVLFVACNLARHLNVNPQKALHQANNKFISRFQQVEKKAYEQYPDKNTFELSLLDELWNDVKKQNK